MKAYELVLSCDTDTKYKKQEEILRRQGLIGIALFYKLELEKDYRRFFKSREEIWLDWADKDASKYLDYLRQLEELEAQQ